LIAGTSEVSSSLSTRISLLAAAVLLCPTLAACASTQDESAAIAQAQLAAAHKQHAKQKAKHRVKVDHARKEAKK